MTPEVAGYVLMDPNTGVICQGVHLTHADAQTEREWRNRSSVYRFEIYELRRPGK